MNLNINLIKKSVLDNQIKQLSKRYAKTTSFCTRPEETITDNNTTSTINVCKVSKKINSQFDPFYDIKKGYVNDNSFENIEVTTNQSNIKFIASSSIDKVVNKRYKQVFEEKDIDDNKYFYGFKYNSIAKISDENTNFIRYSNINMKLMVGYKSKEDISTHSPQNNPIINGLSDASGYFLFEQNDIVKNYMYNINKNKFFINDFHKTIIQDSPGTDTSAILRRTVYPRLDPRCFETYDANKARMYFMDKQHKFNYPTSTAQNTPESLNTKQAYFRASSNNTYATMIDILNSNGGIYTENHTSQHISTWDGHHGTYWEWHTHPLLTDKTRFTTKDEVTNNQYNYVNKQCLNYYLNKTITTLMNWRKNYNGKTNGTNNYFGIKTSKKISNVYERYIIYTAHTAGHSGTSGYNVYKDRFDIVMGTMKGAYVGPQCGVYRENGQAYYPQTNPSFDDSRYVNVTRRYNYYVNDTYNPRYMLGFKCDIKNDRDRTSTSGLFYSKLPIGKIKKFNNITNFLTDDEITHAMKSIRDTTINSRTIYDAFSSDIYHTGMDREIKNITFKTFEEL